MSLPHPAWAKSGRGVLQLGALAAIGLVSGALGSDPPRYLAGELHLQKHLLRLLASFRAAAGATADCW